MEGEDLWGCTTDFWSNMDLLSQQSLIRVGDTGIGEAVLREGARSHPTELLGSASSRELPATLAGMVEKGERGTF